jgi:hypothetical protein
LPEIIFFAAILTISLLNVVLLFVKSRGQSPVAQKEAAKKADGSLDIIIVITIIVI